MKNLAILISGGGTTAEAVITAIKNSTLTGLTPHVISSNPEVKGNERVKNLGISPHIINKKDFSDQDAFGEAILKLLQELDIHLVSLQGWLHLVHPKIVKAYKGNILNQHPGPTDPGRPDFGGYGMTNPYRVSCARLAYTWISGDEAYTESVVHLVEEEFDMGDFIRIEKVTIPAKKEKTTTEKLKENPKELINATHAVVKKLYPVEHVNVIASLQLFSDEKAIPFSRKKPLIPQEFIEFVEPAKKLALELFPYKNL